MGDSVACADILKFKVLAKCSRSRARVAELRIPHAVLQTPIFMPVGTKGTMKGLTPKQLERCGCRMMLSNSYHLAETPGMEVLQKAGDLHNFMKWNNGLLTDSGGFQMVSLAKLTKLDEDGVEFQSPYTGAKMTVTPEYSMQVQNTIGADIMMQLDDVVKTTGEDDRMKDAMYRTIRWLDRCIAAHKRTDHQILFPIVQGGLNFEYRTICAEEMVKRNMQGYAIGGLSGGEPKDQFWPIVKHTAHLLPYNKPRYLMGVGFTLDLIVSVALGCDMFDCVFPTRTARFGIALVPTGQLNLKHSKFKNDFRKIDDECDCQTCQNHTRSYIHHFVTQHAVFASLITIHNVTHHMKLMAKVRESILKDRFPEFVDGYINSQVKRSSTPKWVIDALASVNINIKDHKSTAAASAAVVDDVVDDVATDVVDFGGGGDVVCDGEKCAADGNLTTANCGDSDRK
ncbi:hypothetical protein HELRODRAFT_111078 [Helobdella robusta]|uniref:Queuine tRNA-ribosyltransferase catalytic subunit 1 n=1 Tax=Helobdella robusta TaxID=6412 RepID=T1EF77_HELRO|nr:hypothetical protein HELRODRAFT_111078 [Helobdella robusta]ESO05523.1 hypothetical protein HELRODRAFT_111078 [Helobdella robusta]